MVWYLLALFKSCTKSNIHISNESHDYVFCRTWLRTHRLFLAHLLVLQTRDQLENTVKHLADQNRTERGLNTQLQTQTKNLMVQL